MDKEYFFKRLRNEHPEHLDFYDYNNLPSEFLALSKINIRCPEHGMFSQNAVNHLQGGGCPTCAFQRTMERLKSYIPTTEDVVEKSKKKFGNRFSYEKTVYKDKDSLLTFTCTLHGDFDWLLSSHLRSKYGCPKCNSLITRRLLTESHIEKAKVIHSNKYDYSKVQDLPASEKVEIGCLKHGPFFAYLHAHVFQKTGCPTCAREKDRLTQEDFVEKAKRIHGDAYGYDKVVYTTNLAKVCIVCPEHGEFFQRPNSHLSGNGCKECFLNRNRSTTDEFIAKAKEIHGDTYDYNKVVYTGNKNPVEITCPRHGSFWKTPNQHLSSRSGCQLCCESKGEKSVETVLKKYGIEHIREYRIVPHRFRWDFFLPKFNIFIEFHGHQHYRPVEMFGGDAGFKSTVARDQLKKSILKKMGAKLITLNYLNLTDGTVEKELIKRLRNYLKCWYVIDGEVVAFKNIVEVCKYFNLPNDLTFDCYDDELSKRFSEFRRLF